MQNRQQYAKYPDWGVKVPKLQIETLLFLYPITPNFGPAFLQKQCIEVSSVDM